MSHRCKPQRYFEIMEELEKLYDVKPIEPFAHGSFTDGSSIQKMDEVSAEESRRRIKILAKNTALYLRKQNFIGYKLEMDSLAGEILLYEFLHERDIGIPDKSQRMYIEELRKMQIKPIPCSMAASYNLPFNQPQNPVSSSRFLHPMEERAHSR